MKPLKFIRDTYEGGYTATNLYIYDWPAKLIHADVNFGDSGPQKLEIPLHDKVFDLPSLIYYFRTLDMSKHRPGEKFPFSFAIDDAVFDIALTYHGKEQTYIRKQGKRATEHFSCSVVSGAMFDGNQEVQIWLSDDAYHVPVALRVPLRWGSLQAWIKTYEP